MKFNTTMRAFDASSEANALSYAFKKLLKQNTFIEMVTIESVDSDKKTCIIKPLVIGRSASGEQIEPELVYNIPYFRLQMGTSAVIMDPKEGDIGLLLVCDENTAGVKSTNGPAVAPTGQRHSRQYGIYLGGVALLNSTPDEYIKFTGSGIEIVGDVSITGKLTTTSTIEAEGEVTGNGIKLSAHVHGGVERGGSNTYDPQ